MKTNYRPVMIGATILALALWFVPSRSALAAEKAPEQVKEEKVTPAQVPAAVREALERECRGATIRDITKESAGGKTLYDFEVTREGRAFEFDITADGEVLSRSEQIELSRAPAAVRKTIERMSKGGKIGTVMKESEEGKIKYEAEVTIKGKTVEISVASDGKVITEADEQEAEKGKAVRKKEGGERKSEKLEREQVKAEKEKKGEGKKEARKEKDEEEEKENEQVVKFAELPAAVQKTLKRESAGGKLGEITKDVEDGKAIYEAELTLDGEDYEVEIAANGKLIKKALEEEEDEQAEVKAEGKEKGRKADKGDKKEMKAEKKEKGQKAEGKEKGEGRKKKGEKRGQEKDEDEDR